MAIKINAKEHKVSTVSVFQTNTAVVQRLFSVELQASLLLLRLVSVPSDWENFYVLQITGWTE